MATPTRSQGVSTPRNPLTSTPNRPTASPRPGTGHLQSRPFAHKSPAVKTPASSGQGHSNRISISSQPTSTPVAAPTIHEELLNLNSPAAALIASIGTTGLTPLPSGQDGLGITTGITPTPAHDLSLHRSPELERLYRLQQVAQLLETRSLGRGVTRIGVMALAQKEKFDQVWDGDTVNIAGVSVDLEIAFATDDKDIIHDVMLNLVTDDSGDPQPQESASSMLKRQLITSDGQSKGSPWNSLTDFAANLHYLSHHDRLECSTNAFKIVGGLYQTFQKIWSEEKKRMKERHEALHICHSNVGQPAMDAGKKLGLSTRYWIQKHELVAATSSDVDLDETQLQDWSAKFILNAGEPSISSNQDWLEAEPLNNSITAESVFEDTQAEKPNWKAKDHAPGIDDPVKDAGTDAMDIDSSSMKVPKTLGVQFVGVFEPSVLVPINVLTELNNDAQILQADQSEVTTIQQALYMEVGRPHTPILPDISEERWKRTVSAVDKNGKDIRREFAYALVTGGGSWCYPVSQLSFSHPRQFAEALPILRQYALLWSLLLTAVAGDTDTPTTTSPADVESTRRIPVSKIVKRSNKKPAQVQLDQLLSGKREAGKALNIDLSLDLISDVTQARIDLLLPVRGHNFVQVKIIVRRNGILDVASVVTGLSSTREDQLKRQATRVLRLSEDLGVLVQWLLMQLQPSP